MNKYYFTFGQDHEHIINGIIFDKNCVAEIEASSYKIARDKMFKLFYSKWGFFYNEKPNMKFFPRGIIKV